MDYLCLPVMPYEHLCKWDWVLGIAKNVGRVCQYAMWYSFLLVVRISLPKDLQCKWWYKGAYGVAKAKGKQARSQWGIVPN